MKNLMSDSKKWLKYFYSNGVWEDNPSFKVSGRPVSEDILDFMKEYFKFLIESSFLNEHTIIYLNSNLGSVRAAIESYNEQVLEIDRINVNTAQSNITRDKNRLQKYFEDGMIDNILHYPEKYLDKAWEDLDKVQRKYMNDKVYKQSMVIDIPKDKICRELDDYSWVKLTNLLETYSVRKIEKILSCNGDITEDMFGYYNYLISSKRLNKSEKARLEVIKTILGI